MDNWECKRYLLISSFVACPAAWRFSALRADWVKAF
jgi:hypothetical protein